MAEAPDTAASWSLEFWRLVLGLYKARRRWELCLAAGDATLTLDECQTLVETARDNLYSFVAALIPASSPISVKPAGCSE